MFFLFRKKPKPSPESLVEEVWNTSFRKPRNCRFQPEEGEKYGSILKPNLRGGALELTLKKRNLFAWVENPLYRYRDFSLFARISLPVKPYGSAGLMFRYIDESTFYYFLISNKGYFRFDLVFNGNPRTLIPWTDTGLCREELCSPEGVGLRVIASGNRFLFALEELWIAEIEEESINSGSFNFAAQNYEEEDNFTASLLEITLESRPVQVEAHFQRWSSFLPINPARRITLAESLFSLGQYAAALVQLKRAMKQEPLKREQYLLLSECFRNLGLYKEALKALDKMPEEIPSSRDLVVQKANLLYSLNSFMELKDFALKTLETYPEEHWLMNLAGHSEYALGNWMSAQKWYSKAGEAEEGSPVYNLNAARAALKAKLPAEAWKHYLKAARKYFRRGEYGEVELLIEEIQPLFPQEGEVLSLKGKLFFYRNKFEEAEKCFRALEKENKADSSVLFLLGLCLIREGKQVKGISYLKKAATMEPEDPVYWFKLAEHQHLAGKDSAKALEKALALSPQDPWVLNLAGLAALNRGKHREALEYFSRAYKLSPAEADLAVNYSEALFISGERKKSFSVLASVENRPQISNQRGNLYYRLKQYDKALSEYEAAVSGEPANGVYRENCADAALRAGNLGRSEELYAALCTQGGSASCFYNLGVIAKRKGEYQRALAALREAVRKDPESRVFLEALARHYLFLGDLPAAKAEALKLKALEVQTGMAETRGDQILEEVRTGLEDSIECFSCGRKWYFPRNLEEQPPVKLIGEPRPESPAGRCNLCGKVYCVACASSCIVDNRFTCRECGGILKLPDKELRYLVKIYAAEEGN